MMAFFKSHLEILKLLVSSINYMSQTTRYFDEVTFTMNRPHSYKNIGAFWHSKTGMERNALGRKFSPIDTQKAVCGEEVPYLRQIGIFLKFYRWNIYSLNILNDLRWFNEENSWGINSRSTCQYFLIYMCILVFRRNRRSYGQNISVSKLEWFHLAFNGVKFFDVKVLGFFFLHSLSSSCIVFYLFTENNVQILYMK